MDSSGPEFDKGEGSVEEDDKDPQQGGGGAVCVRFVLGHYSVGTAFRHGDMGSYPPYGPGHGGVPVPYVTIIDRADPTAAGRKELGIHLIGSSKGRGGF